MDGTQAILRLATKDRPHHEDFLQSITADSISIVDNVYFTGLSRDFNAKGVTTLLGPNVFLLTTLLPQQNVLLYVCSSK